MIRYLLGRFFQSLIVVILVSMIVFLLIHLLPGSPAKAELGIKATPAAIKIFNQINGYDHPVPVQYVIYIHHLLQGNLGFSYVQNSSVASLIGSRLPKSALLVGLSLLLTIVVSIPLGIYQAVKRNKLPDYILTGTAFTLYAFPTFWLGFLLIDILALQLHFFPPAAPDTNSLSGIISDWHALVLPVLTLSLGSIAGYSRYMRSSAVESMIQDYVRTARMKGVSERRIMFGHVLRNSLIPMATLIGLSLPALLGGALITEEIFNYPGLGMLFYQAASDQDYSILMALCLIGAIGVVAGNFIADLLYAMLDPRIRLT